jgi:hypothetical protein
MACLRGSIGAESDEVRSEAIVEVARYAQSLDASPTLNVSAGIRIAGILIIRERWPDKAGR